MTRLPTESWNVRPRLDLPPYALNEVCPITGETFGLEDHHIFRRSFTALRYDNENLYWVEYKDWNYSGPAIVVKNRVALSPDAHSRITTNRARLGYQGEDLFYIEDGEAKLLDLTLRLMAPTEKVSKPRRKKTPEKARERRRYLVHVPADEENLLPETIDAVRGHLAPQMNWQDDVPDYYVLMASLAGALQ